MRGDLDETLARMARREEALRRANDPVGGRNARPGAERHDPVPGPPTERDEPAGSGVATVGGPDPVQAVVEAVSRVVAAHPGVAVSLRVEHAGQAYPVRVGWSDRGVTVGTENEAVPPPVWPMPARTEPAWTNAPEGAAPDPAARLAEMIRRDPSLLRDDGGPR
ncbi:hypothetical protein ACN28G_23495 [Micromonospora sp. WMMA1923]|uniref:hypothetical protein n=1 Tax=Micromonospora sp. WMMA1923 TaxID=3404125 RepID=UPI003B9343C1